VLLLKSFLLLYQLDGKIKSSFGGLVSTSNAFKNDEIVETLQGQRIYTVNVVTDVPLVWTVEVDLMNKRNLLRDIEN